MKTCSRAGFWELKHSYVCSVSSAVHPVQLRSHAVSASMIMSLCDPLAPISPRISVLLPYLFLLGSSGSPDTFSIRSEKSVQLLSFFAVETKWHLQAPYMGVQKPMSSCIFCFPSAFFWGRSWKAASLAFSVCHIQENFMNSLLRPSLRVIYPYPWPWSQSWNPSTSTP